MYAVTHWAASPIFHPSVVLRDRRGGGAGQKLAVHFDRCGGRVRGERGGVLSGSAFRPHSEKKNSSAPWVLARFARSMACVWEYARLPLALIRCACSTTWVHGRDSISSRHRGSRAASSRNSTPTTCE